ncbi:MAG: hypothetical protein AAFN78_18885, partial [Pseudomonadota bacterium]
MSSTRRQVSEVLSELARDNYRGLIDPHTYRLQRAQLLDELVVDEDEEEASSTTRPQAPSRDRRAANPPLSDPANQRRRNVDRVREQIETAEVLEVLEAARRKVKEASEAASAASAKTEPPVSAPRDPADTPESRPATPAPSPPESTVPGSASAQSSPPAGSASRMPLIAGIVAA